MARLDVVEPEGGAQVQNPTRSLCLQYYPFPVWVCMCCVGLMGLLELALGADWLSGCSGMIYVSVYLIISGIIDLVLFATARFHKAECMKCKTYLIPIQPSFATIMWIIRLVWLLIGLISMGIAVRNITLNPELACTQHMAKFALASVIIGCLLTFFILSVIVGRRGSGVAPGT
ncbi:hypothetical protein ScPMuIL_006740 [Solemya velum]